MLGSDGTRSGVILRRRSRRHAAPGVPRVATVRVVPDRVRWPGGLLGALLIGASLVGVVGFSTGGAGAATTVDAPGSIDATGHQDVTGALTLLFTSAPAGSTVRLAPNGRYRVDGTVVVRGRHDVVIDGQGATLFAPTDGTGALNARGRVGGARLARSRAHLLIFGGAGVTVQNLSIQGPNGSGTYQPALEAQAGVVIRKSQRVVLDRMTVRTTFGDGVYVIGQSTGIDIRDSTFDHNGRQGVAVVGGSGVTVERSVIRNPGRSAIDLEPAGGMASGIHIQDNQVVDATNALVAALGAGAGVDDVWVQRNRVSGGHGLTIAAGVPGALRSGFHVIDNTATGTGDGLNGVLMSFLHFDGVEVRGNHQKVAAGVVPVSFTNSCHTTVAGNDFGAGALPVHTSGDCSTAGGLPAGRAPGTRAGAGVRPIRPGRTTTTTEPPRTVVVTRTVHSSSPLAIALAFLAGIAAGAGGLYLSQYVRRTERPAGGPEPTDPTGPSDRSPDGPGADAPPVDETVGDEDGAAPEPDPSP